MVKHAFCMVKNEYSIRWKKLTDLGLAWKVLRDLAWRSCVEVLRGVLRELWLAVYPFRIAPILMIQYAFCSYWPDLSFETIKKYPLFFLIFGMGAGAGGWGSCVELAWTLRGPCVDLAWALRGKPCGTLRLTFRYALRKTLRGLAGITFSRLIFSMKYNEYVKKIDVASPRDLWSNYSLKAL